MGYEDIALELAEKLRLAAVAPNILTYEPHQKQILFHSNPAKGRLYIGGNRSGKSVGGVVEGIWRLIGQHPYQEVPEPPVRGRVIAVDFLNGIEKIIKPLYKQWLPASYLKGGSWDTAYSARDRVLTLQNGSTLEFMSYDQDLDKFAGTSRHFIHFDEEPPKNIFTENRARIIDTGGIYFITMTPVEGMTWVYDDIYLPGIAGDRYIGIIEVDMAENPHLSPDEIEYFLSGLSKDEQEARKAGKFVQIGGLVYKAFDQNVHVVEPFIPPKDWEWYASVDHGFNNPTAWLWHAVSPEGDVYTFGEHYAAEQTLDFHATTVHERNTFYGRVPDVYVGDPALAQRNGVTGTSIFTEYANLGISIAPGNNDVMTGIAKIQNYLNGPEPKWHVTEDCPNLIKEMQRLRWKVWANSKSEQQNNKHDLIQKKDDHAADSLRYFFTFVPDLAPVAKEFGRRRPLTVPFHATTMASNKDWHLQESKTDWDVSPSDLTLGGIW